MSRSLSLPWLTRPHPRAPLPADRVQRPFVERAEHHPGWADRLADTLFAATLGRWQTHALQARRQYEPLLAAVRRHTEGVDALDDAALRARIDRLRPALRRQGFEPALVGEAFALLREASGRVLGRRHFDTQMMGAWGLLNGRLVEMATGEGKTLTAALAAATAALAGRPVHVITVNDYLAQRDAHDLGPLYRFLGLDVGAVVQGMPPPERRRAYAQPIAYCTNKELAFDYLRDRVALGERHSPLHMLLERLGGARAAEGLVLRGLHFAIVDEADSVFIDEARTPLILSATAQGSELAENCRQALALAQTLQPGRDFKIDLSIHLVTLTDDGLDAVDDFAEPLDGVWTSLRGREELVRQALSALHFFRRDEHYVVADGKVQIVDESTGRILPDRSWERGLHQMIETKEGVELTNERKTLARITYQRLFRRYLVLGGMTGTAREVAPELRAVYGLSVVPVPLNKPSLRMMHPPRLLATAAEKWQAVAEEVQRVALGDGRPVLIGTRSVKASEDISAVLTQRGLAHALLNAKQDSAEAEIVARAGEAGRITVATNMAGRGTDILLDDAVLQRGGLHVILTEYHETQRVDRQLFGRCARQGDPGSCAVIVSLEDELFTVQAPWATRLAALRLAGGRALSPHHIQTLRRLAQARAQRLHAQVRVQNLKQDRQLDQLLSFTGRQP